MQECPAKHSTINPDMSRTPFCKVCINYRAVVPSVYARFTTRAAEAVCLYAKQPCLRGFPRFPPLTHHSQAYAQEEGTSCKVSNRNKLHEVMLSPLA